jgi:hypothetical protein
MQMENKNLESCLGCGVILLGVIVVANFEKVESLFAHTAPELILAILATVAWFILRHRENFVCKAAASLLGPVAVGLALLTLLLMVLNGGRLTASYGMVASAEGFLIALRLAISDAVTVSLPAFIGAIGALIALSAVVPNLRGVTTFVNVKKRVGQLGAVLAVITSFTLFAYVPGGPALDAHYDEMMTRFDASLRHERTALARIAAAKTLSHDLGKASPARRKQIHVALIQLHDLGDDHGGAFPANAAILHARLPPVAPPEPSPRSIPGTTRAYDDARKQADDSEARAASAETSESEAEEGVKQIIGEIIGHAVPELEGYAGKFVSKMIDELSERFYEPLVERIMTRNPEIHGDEVVKKARKEIGKRPLLDINALARIAQRLDTDKKAADEKARLASDKDARERSTTLSDSFNNRFYVPPLMDLTFTNIETFQVPAFDPVVRTEHPEYFRGH